MKLIGKGLFTKCYLQECGKKVFLVSSDPVKECMSLGWFPNSRLFPNVTSIVGGYEMKFYPYQSSLKYNLKPTHYAIYNNLRSLVLGNNCTGYDNLFELFNTIKNKRVKDALLGALDAISNYGYDISFEISPRNVRVSNTGELILLDCFFIQSYANKIRSKYYYY